MMRAVRWPPWHYILRRWKQILKAQIVFKRTLCKTYRRPTQFIPKSPAQNLISAQSTRSCVNVRRNWFKLRCLRFIVPLEILSMLYLTRQSDWFIETRLEPWPQDMGNKINTNTYGEISDVSPQLNILIFKLNKLYFSHDL
jgi:hypothetical protein